MSGAWKWMAVLTFVIVGLVVLGEGASGIAGAVKTNTTYNVVFNESGLGAGTTWCVTINSASSCSSSTSLVVSGLSITSYYWYLTSAPTFAGGQYAGTPSSGYFYPNYQLSQDIVFQKQDSVAFAVIPAGSPIPGTTTPSSSTFYNVGSTQVISATPNVGFTFQKWTSSSPSLSVKSATSQSTILTVGVPGTVTAHFLVAKTKTTFTEQGLSPAALAAGWSVTFGGSPYFSSATTLATASLGVGSYYWSIPAVVVGSGDEFVAVPSSSSLYMPYTTTVTIQFVEYYQITFSVSGSGTVSPSSGFYAKGSALGIMADASTSNVFSSWTAPAALHIGSTSASATNITVSAPGTVTATFTSGVQCTTCTATFYEVGLPTGTTWGVTFGSVFYSSSTTSITVSNAVAGYYYPSNPVGTGSTTTVYAPNPTSAYLYLTGQTSAEIIYTKEYYVSLLVMGSSDYILYQSSGWYPQHSVVGLSTQASGYTKFSKWTTSTGGPTLSSTTKASIFMTVNAAGTVTAIFTTPTNKIEFAQVGMPVGTGWGVTINGISYYSTGWDLNVTGIASYPYQTIYPVTGIYAGATGVEWQTTPTSFNMNVPYQLFQEILYTKWVSVTLAQTGGGSTIPSGTAWYPMGGTIAVAGVNGTTVAFSSWSAVPGAAVTFGSTSAPTTLATLTGSATITAKFV